jgi:hypothetical protein
MIHYLKTYIGHYIGSKGVVVWILEILRHLTKVIIKISEMAKHISLVQCGHSTQVGEG